jgi:hypothetical protein
LPHKPQAIEGQNEGVNKLKTGERGRERERGPTSGAEAGGREVNIAPVIRAFLRQNHTLVGKIQRTERARSQ